MNERDIFLALLDLPDAAARAAYLDKACGGDRELRGKVEALLGAHDHAGSFLLTPLVAPRDPDEAATKAVAPSAKVPAPGSEGDDEEPLTFLDPPGGPGSLGRIGHYEVLQVLGRGAFGIVFRALDDVLRRVVAVKVLAPRVATTSPARKRFLREARASAAVRHDHVVQVYAVEEQPLPYLVMEFIPGETLQQRLDRTGPLDVADVLRIGRQIAEGLAAAHANDLIHRDVKPGNVLLEGPQHRVKLTDFGLARAADDASLSQSGLIAGTPMYMAPEQAKGERIDHRADLFSLGSVLYQMVTGRPPFRANGTLAVLKRVAEDTPRPIREIIPETPAWLASLIARLHAKNPADRFQSAREVADVLADCEARLKACTESNRFPPVDAGPPRRWGGRKRVALAGLLGCLAVAFGVGAYALSRPGRDAAGGVIPAVPPAAGDLALDRGAAVYVVSVGGAVRVNDGDAFLGTIEQLPKTPFTLTTVSFRDNPKVTDEGLGFLQCCRNVKHLDLAVTKVTDVGLANFKDCRDLRHLDLFSTAVGDAGVGHYKGCKMTHLSLRSTRVTDAVGAMFGHCADLEFLGLAHTQVTEAGLAHFRGCKKLRHLDLDALPVGDAGVAHFAGCQNLEVAHLSGTLVTDPGVAWLTGCKRLKTLHLRGTKVTAAGIADLTAALPGCRIEWDGGDSPPR